MDAYARRESFDVLLDEVHALDLDSADADAVAAAALNALPKLLEAAGHVDPGEPQLRAELRYETANLCLALGRVTKRETYLDQARRYAEQGLADIASENAGVLEARLRYVHAGALTLAGQIAPAIEALSRVVALLEPHVAEMQRIRAHGSDAERHVVAFIDRRAQAESLLEEARAGVRMLSAMMGEVRAASSASGVAIDEKKSEAVLAAERTNARVADPRTTLMQMAGVTLVAAGCFFYFDSLLLRLVAAAVVVMSVATTVAYLRRTRS